jgi:hypothetical protein
MKNVEEGPLSIFIVLGIQSAIKRIFCCKKGLILSIVGSNCLANLKGLPK